MADESGTASGGGKYRGRKRKTGTRKSSRTTKGDYWWDKDGRLFGVAKPATPEEIAQYGSGMKNAASMGSFVTPSESYHLKESRKRYEAPGGIDMTNVAPQVTMEAKRPAPQRLDDLATGYNDGYDPTQQFMDLATSLLTDTGGGTYDYETAQREAANAIRQSYGAEINAIRQNNRVARKSSKRARKEIEHLYKGLAKMYGKQEERAVKRGDRYADKQMGIAEQGNTILQDLNNTMIQDETAMLQNLGQQQAAGELISPDYDRMGEQVADNTNQGQRAASQALRQGANNARWFDRAQGGARLEGANAQADMLGQLQAYLMDNRNQIAGLRGDRAQEVAASNMNIQSQAAEAAGDAQQQTFDNVLKLLGVQTDIEDTNADNQRADANFRWDKKMDRKNLRLKMLDSAETGDTDSLANYDPGIRDAMSIIAQQQDPGDKKATEALWKLFSSDAWRTGEVALPGNAGQTANLTPYEAGARARKVGLRLGLKGRELQEFVNAAAASV